MQDVIVKIYSEDPDWSSTDSVDVDDPVPTPAAVEGNVRSRQGYPPPPPQKIFLWPLAIGGGLTYVKIQV